MTNHKIQNRFDNIRDSYNTFTSSVTEAMASYRQKMTTAKICYSEALYKEKSAEYASEARAAIAAANDKLCADVGSNIDDLRGMMHQHITATIPASFVDTLRNYKDFGVKLTRTELDQYMKQANGSYPALRLLDAVAKPSGFTVKMSTVEDFEKDLHRLTPTNPMLWCPADYFEEGKALLPDVPAFRADGSVYASFGRPDTVHLLVQATVLENRLKGIDDACARWDAGFVPTIADFKVAAQEANPNIGATESSKLAEAQHAEAVSNASSLSAYDDFNERMNEAYNQKQESKACEIRKAYGLSE